MIVRILMIVWTSVVTDTRVLREATTLVAAGHAVHIIGKDVPADFVPPVGLTVEGATGTSTLKRAAGSAVQVGPSRTLSPPVRLARWALLPNHVAASHRSWVKQARVLARRTVFDVVHAHDFTALPLAAELAAEAGVPYVYDTHEYWFGRSRSGRPSPLRRRIDRRSEHRLGGKAAAVITVGDGVAAQLRSDFGWDVTVVRNSFPTSDPPLAQVAAVPTGLVYAGRIGEHRDLETVAAAAPAVAPLRVTIVGPADPTFLAGFAAQSVDVLEALPVAEVTELLRSQGLALVAHDGHSVNHRLAMPNKLFHAVHAGVPVVAVATEELAQLVRTYGIGTLYEAGDARSLVAAVREAVARYPELVAAVQSAAPELSWASDAARLVEIYARLESPGPDRSTVPAGLEGQQ